jgi:hypothetical protein
VPNHEPAGSDHRYPLAMISPPARNFLNSTFVNVQSLRDIEGEPVLEISEADAVARGIATGDVVRVFNDRGSYRCKATVSSRARSGVVNGLGIWWRKLGLNGTNVNEVTSQKLTDLGARRCSTTAWWRWPGSDQVPQAATVVLAGKVTVPFTVPTSVPEKPFRTLLANVMLRAARLTDTPAVMPAARLLSPMPQLKSVLKKLAFNTFWSLRRKYTLIS